MSPLFMNCSPLFVYGTWALPITSYVYMDKKEARTAWIVAGVLAVLLIITVIFWMNVKKDFDEVQRDGYKNIGMLRDRIALDCPKEDAESQKRCRQHIDDLSTVLTEFSEDLKEATETATTTPTAQ